MAGSFGDLPYPKRGAHLGDDAESVFERVETGWVRFGLNRPPFDVSQLPPMLRHAPDYLQVHRFADVVVFGRDRRPKVTVGKLLALIGWNQVHPTDLWLWDWVEQAYGRINVETFMRLVCIEGRGGRFESDGREHWSIDAADIEPIVWTPVGGELGG